MSITSSAPANCSTPSPLPKTEAEEDLSLLKTLIGQLIDAANNQDMYKIHDLRFQIKALVKYLNELMQKNAGSFTGSEMKTESNLFNFWADFNGCDDNDYTDILAYGGAMWGYADSLYSDLTN